MDIIYFFFVSACIRMYNQTVKCYYENFPFMHMSTYIVLERIVKYPIHLYLHIQVNICILHKYIQFRERERERERERALFFRYKRPSRYEWFFPITSLREKSRLFCFADDIYLRGRFNTRQNCVCSLLLSQTVFSWIGNSNCIFSLT